jgi:hypothetical protein
VGGLRPRDPGEIVGPRPLSGVVVRPLNFTVRGRRYAPVLRDLALNSTTTDLRRPL